MEGGEVEERENVQQPKKMESRMECHDYFEEQCLFEDATKDIKVYFFINKLNEISKAKVILAVYYARLYEDNKNRCIRVNKHYKHNRTAKVWCNLSATLAEMQLKKLKNHSKIKSNQSNSFPSQRLMYSKESQTGTQCINARMIG